MCLFEEKRQYVKCNILLKLKQLSLLIICFCASIILSISFAIVGFNNGVCISCFFDLALLVSLFVFIFRTRKSAEKAWESVFGQNTSLCTTIELVQEGSLSIKRESFNSIKIVKLSEIKNVEKFGSAITLMFSDSTSLTLSPNAETKDLNNLIEIEQINSKRISSRKSFIDKTLIQLCICIFLLSFFVSFIISDAFTLSTVAWIQFSYIMYFFAIFPLIVSIVSMILKRRKVAIIAIITIAFIALFGSFRFFFNSRINYDTNVLNDVEQRLDYDLPDANRLITKDDVYFTSSVGKFNENKLLVDLENNIQSENKWISNLDLDTTETVNRLIAEKTKNFNYFMVYNEKSKIYYDSPIVKDIKDCIIFAYKIDTHTFCALYDIENIN